MDAPSAAAVDLDEQRAGSDEAVEQAKADVDAPTRITAQVDYEAARMNRRQLVQELLEAVGHTLFRESPEPDVGDVILDDVGRDVLDLDRGTNDDESQVLARPRPVDRKRHGYSFRPTDLLGNLFEGLAVGGLAIDGGNHVAAHEPGRLGRASGEDFRNRHARPRRSYSDPPVANIAP